MRSLCNNSKTEVCLFFCFSFFSCPVALLLGFSRAPGEVNAVDRLLDKGCSLLLCLLCWALQESFPPFFLLLKTLTLPAGTSEAHASCRVL